MQYFFITIKSFNNTKQNLIGITEDNVQIGIPADPANSDYQVYLAWIAEGNVAEEWNPDAPE